MTPSERHRRITEIFIAVSGIAPGRRSSMLDRLCETVPDLREEVELLLSFHDQLMSASRDLRTD